MDNLVEEVTCPVCLEIYTNPHILMCGHNVCLSCAKSIPRITSTYPNLKAIGCNVEELCCPLCRKTTLSSELKPNITLANIVDHLKHGKSVVAKPSVCKRCKSKEATLHCSDCYYSVCKECSDIIHQGDFISHRVGPFNEMKCPPRCTQHQKKQSLMCEDDMMLICAYCTFDGHQGHKITPVGIAVKKLVPMANERLALVARRKQNLQETIQEIDNVIKEEQKEKGKVEKSFIDTFGEIQRILDEKKQILSQQISDAFNFPESMQLRQNLTNEVARINEFQLTTAYLMTLDDVEIAGHICALSKIDNKDNPLPSVDRHLFKLGVNATETIALINKFKFECFTTSPIFGNGSDGELVVDGLWELDPSHPHNYSNITIRSGGILTVSTNQPLILYVLGVFLIEKGGKVDLNGKGYAGGVTIPSETDGNAFQGSSFEGQPQRYQQANRGGGGGGRGSGSFGSIGGGGGGYGSVGQNSAPNLYSGNNPGGAGGNVYGDAMISVLHLGSGGGAGHPCSDGGTFGGGGYGGGAVRVFACSFINHGTISCDGKIGASGNGYGSGGGGGSGGSIHVHAITFENRGRMSANGGTGGAKGNIHPCNSGGGMGGVGRIRVDTKVKSNPFLGLMEPKAGNLGYF